MNFFFVVPIFCEIRSGSPDRFANEMAVLWRGNRSSDVITELIDRLTWPRARVITLTADRTQSLQAENVMICVVPQRHPRSSDVSFGDEEVRAGLIRKA